MKIIGITGGVGSGKSQVLSFVQKEYQGYVCEADRVAWDLQNPGQSCYAQIVDIFGADVLNDDQTIDRKKLGGIVFANPEKLQRLNRIMHPEVKKAILKIIGAEKEKGTTLFFLEAALFFEDSYDELCDEVWYIYTNEEIRRSRILSSRDYDDEKVTAIMKSQKSDAFFREKSHRVIDNNGDFSQTILQIKEVVDKWEN